ncbi:MAG TPA: ribose-phosphate pyrophosphokinase [Bacillota bacterium]|mgnify:CR=1 FL=1|nr:ribose-phosphate pyrophosphokinase [Candidatus Fermentithermobacillaceae bacterium]HOB30925.1 ribose-phosphate pyrophosphokinase [Bacillota bacterium]HOK64721.1 ribose-phosphate pyrophosphokinase [Bacillota bacterium]HOL12268.1 ribose-phosphate pyrophosphokinase [Bacillota bacterium]HOQ03350.1 ribose-phosphate pyrophosphokinase [Bacillota bacterium]
MFRYSGQDLKIFSGNANKELASSICRHVGVPEGAIEVGRFSNGEIKVIINENVRGSDVFVVQPTCHPVNDNLMELLIIIDALRRASASRITAVIPHYGYARQDRKTRGREPITAKLVANLLVTAGVDRVLTMDLHAGQIQGFFDIPVDHLTAIPLLADYFIMQNLEDMVVVSPDAGGIARVRDMAERLGAPVAFVDKRRPEPNVAEVMNIVGMVEGKNAILLDDIIDTGGSIVQAATALIEKGAASVMACATHPVFSGNASSVLLNADLREIVVTDTIPIADDMKEAVRVISVAEMFGDAIVRIHEGRSISTMFR